ncbi:MAG: dephospho-CoA kinase, partial [Candidatus Omnitrophota bacterium]
MPRPRKNNKTIIGLTGSFGSGKSTVAGIFAAYGARVIDADKIARAAVRRGSKVYKKIISSFGSRVLGRNKAIDRRKLAGLVFNDPK